MIDESSVACKMLKKLLLQNRLLDEAAWDAFAGEDDLPWGSTLPEMLVERGLVREAVMGKIVKAIEGKGQSFEAVANPHEVSFDNEVEDETIFLDATSDSQVIEIPDPERSLELEEEPMLSLGEPEAEVAELAPALEDGHDRPVWEAPPAVVSSVAEDEERLQQETVCQPVGPGKNLLDLVKKARAAKASDLHISTSVPAFMRLNGQLVRMETPSFTAEETEAMLFDILNGDQKRRAKKEQQLDFCLHAPDGGRCRSNIALEHHGWMGSFRIIPSKIPTLQELGLPPHLKVLTEYSQGLVLVTGARGCGKTTTLASMVDLINQNRKDHIITIEDPIEYEYQQKNCRVTQRSLGSHTLSYANAMKAALREDPDVILVGELRDLETTSMAITASETGHIVLASMHTASADRTIDRLVDLFPPDQQAQIRSMVAESFRGIICQQLLPRKDGQGMVAAVEVLMNNTSVRKMILEGRTFQLESVLQTSKKQGMVRMDDSIQSLLQQGLIEKSVALEHMRKPGSL